MKISNMIKRVISLVMAFILAIPSGVGNFVITANAAQTINEDSPISISLEWMDSKFKNGTALNIVENEYVRNTVKMKVSYSSEIIREEGYDPGELVITVKGIGNVNREGTIEALVGADRQSDSTKTRDWSYTWNKANDTYTLTNNEKIKGNSVFSGYFELVWEIHSRKSIDGYKQSGMQAVLYLPDGGSVSSNTLSLTNDTKADTFAVHIEQHEMYSYEGLTDGIDNPDDYAFIRYNLGATDYENSRGLKTYNYLFDPDANDVGSGAIVISTVLDCSNQGDGTYRVDISSNGVLDADEFEAAMEEQYLFVAYPKNAYAKKSVTASITKYGAYYEGDDSGNTGILQLARDTINIPIPNDFSFTDIPGVIYDFWKDTFYDKNGDDKAIQERGGDIPGSKMRNGSTETFYLEGFVNSPWEKYTLEIVDDFLYILKNNGNFRQLEAGEYSITSVTIPKASSLININDLPIQSDVYNVSVYVARNGEKINTKSGSPAWEGVISDINSTVSLPEGTTAVAVVLHDIAESIRGYTIPIKVKFNTKDTSGLAFGEQDNLTGGQVVNTSFIKIYDETDAWFNDGFTKDHYIDDTNLHLAQKDINVYGSYLDRERDNITFYEGEKNDYRAYTALSEISSEGSRYITRFTMGASFYFKNEDHPNRFSLYTILDESLSLSGYKFQEDIWDIMTLEGLDMSEQKLISACTPEIIDNYNGSGRTYIALHFDFGDTQVPQEGKIRAHFKMRVDNAVVRKSYSIRARSAVIIDNSVPQYPISKKNDNGSWGDSEVLFCDIDRDGNTEELLAYNFDSISQAYADSSQLQLTKYVSTTYSDGWVQLPDVPREEYGGAYQYNLYIKNGNSKSSNIVVRDVLEAGENMQWQGLFQSVDLSQCDKIGLKGTVYYSSSANPSQSLSSQDWSTSKPSNVKAIAIDFGNCTLKEGQELNVIINMKAPTDASLKDKITENGYSASFTMTDSNSGNVTKYDSLVSNFVQVKLSPPLRSIIVTKVDEVSDDKLDGAKFALVNKETGETIAEEVSNAKGYAIFRDVPADATYIIREIEAPVGYEKISDIEVDMNGTTQRVTLKDPRKLGRIQVYKGNNLDEDIPVANAEYTLYDANGNVVNTAVTDTKGIAVFEAVKWGSYTIKETGSPAGFHLNATEYHVEVNRETVSETLVVDTVDIQEDVSVSVTKYVKTVAGDKTNIPLQGATFELVRKVGDIGNRVGLYVTDANGKIDLAELPYGEYYFREKRAPVGYTATENVEFTLSPDNKDVVLNIYNQRIPGSVIITKKDNLGNLLKDIEFSLYDKVYSEEELKSTKPIQKAKTDEYGLAHFDKLEWGTYYILETKAPSCYNMDTEWKEIIIDAKTQKVAMEVVNETKKGTIILTKTDEAGIILLNGAEYTLYSDNGSVIGTYTTQKVNGKNGILVVENLEWGSYYFKETKAPDGYGLSDETIRFSVNSLNAGITQEIEVTDPLDARSITITKRIKADDINFDNGNPTFMFKVEGKDAVSLENHTYYRVIAFDENYVKNHVEVIDKENWVSQSVTISGLMIGHYMVTEEDTSRYYLTGITDIVNGQKKGIGVEIDLYNNKDGSATFVNERYENQDFSDTKVVTNVLKERAKLTALKAVYGADTAEAESAVDRSILTVTAFYDDGTSKVLGDNEYTLDINTFPNVNGDYTVTVSYEENGITKKDNFKVTLYGMKIRIVSLSATLKNNAAVEPQTKITPDMFTVKATYNNGNIVTLKSSEYTVSPNAAPAIDGNFDVVISLDLSKIPNDGYAVSTTVKMEVEYPDPVLETGAKFKTHLSNLAPSATSVVFTDEVAPSGVTLTDVSAAGDGSVVAWLDGTTFKVSSQRGGIKIMANQTCSGMFNKSNNDLIVSIDFDNLDTSKTTDMSSMFRNRANLTTIDFGSNFNTSNVKNMSYMFAYSGYCDKPANIAALSKWNVSSVTNMSYMFTSSNITTLDGLSSWNVSSVKDMSYMFYYCMDLTDVSGISNWNVSSVTNMCDMFQCCQKVTSFNLSSWNVSSVKDMSAMFAQCTAATNFNLSGWKASSATDMSYMFSKCTALKNLDGLSNWDVSSVKDMSYMFNGCTALKNLDGLSNWKLAAVTNMSNMFNECTALNYIDGLSNWNVSSVTDMKAMFKQCRGLVSIDALSSWDVSSVTNMGSMFYGCTNTSLCDVDALINWNVSSVTDMSGMFYECYYLNSVNGIKNWNVSSVTNMRLMFYSCDDVTTYNLAKWNVSSVTDMTGMFYYCNGATTFDLSGWDVSSVTAMDYMFQSCGSVRTARARTQADADKLNSAHDYSWKFTATQ